MPVRGKFIETLVGSRTSLCFVAGWPNLAWAESSRQGRGSLELWRGGTLPQANTTPGPHIGRSRSRGWRLVVLLAGDGGGNKAKR